MSIDDSNTLADTIKRLANDPDHCARLGQNARLAFDTSYSDEVAMAKWSALVNAHFEAIAA